MKNLHGFLATLANNFLDFVVCFPSFEERKWGWVPYFSFYPLVLWLLTVLLVTVNFFFIKYKYFSMKRGKLKIFFFNWPHKCEFGKIRKIDSSDWTFFHEKEEAEIFVFGETSSIRFCFATFILEIYFFASFHWY